MRRGGGRGGGSRVFSKSKKMYVTYVPTITLDHELLEYRIGKVLAYTKRQISTYGVRMI